MAMLVFRMGSGSDLFVGKTKEKQKADENHLLLTILAEDAGNASDFLELIEKYP